MTTARESLYLLPPSHKITSIPDCLITPHWFTMAVGPTEWALLIDTHISVSFVLFLSIIDVKELLYFCLWLNQHLLGIIELSFGMTLAFFGLNLQIPVLVNSVSKIWLHCFDCNITEIIDKFTKLYIWGSKKWP